MKKIAFIINKYVDIATGGEPSIHTRVINLLVEKGFQVDVYCQHYLKTLDNSPVNVYSFIDFNEEDYIKQILDTKYDLIFGGKKVLKYKEIKPDIVSLHAHSDLFQQKSKFGLLYHIFKPRKKRIKTESENFIRNSKSKFIFCSDILKKDYSQICEVKDFAVINPYPNFIPKEGYEKSKNDIFTFGISALGFQNKGGYLTIKSAFLLKLIGKKFKLKIIYRKKPAFEHKLLVWLLGLSKNIEFLQRQDDMSEFYESIDCLILASQLESFGMVALEASAYGLPVIASSNSGFSDLIVDGKNGYVFKFDFNRMFNLFRKMKQAYDNKENLELVENIAKIKMNTIDSYNAEIYALIMDCLEKKNN